MEQNSNSLILSTDQPYHRTTVKEMTDQELESWVMGVRHRRMLLQKEMAEHIESKQKIKSVKAQEEMQAQLVMLEKELKSYDTLTLKLDKRLSKIRQLRLIAERTT